MTLTRADRQAQTRGALLDAAAEVFRDRGLEGGSIDEISQRAGFTKGAFYANFESKQDLYLAMLDERFGAEMDRLDASLAGSGEPGDEARAAAEQFIRLAHEDSDWSRLFFEFTAYAVRDEGFRRALAERYGENQQRMVGVLERWIGGLPAQPPIPIAEIAKMTFAMANGYLIEQLIDPELDEELYGTMMVIFFRGLQALAED